jgi:predicted enzyme related to lactoylglutathione lyase
LVKFCSWLSQQVFGDKNLGCFIHHVTLVSPEHDRLTAFIRDVLDFPVQMLTSVPGRDIGAIFGWSDVPVSVRSTVLGQGHRGLLEVVDAPFASRKKDVPHEAHVCISVPSLLVAIESARAFGVDVINGPVRFEVGPESVWVAVIDVAGARFQLTSIASTGLPPDEAA